MQHNYLGGRCGLKVSNFCLGTMTFGQSVMPGQCDEAKDAMTTPHDEAKDTASSWGSWLAGTAGIDTNTIDSLSKKATAKLSDVSKQLETAFYH